jgi:hypothetical protein
MTSFILKLIIAITPLILLVGGIVLLSGRCSARSRKIVLKRRTCRSMQRALAVGIHLR